MFLMMPRTRVCYLYDSRTGEIICQLLMREFEAVNQLLFTIRIYCCIFWVIFRFISAEDDIWRIYDSFYINLRPCIVDFSRYLKQTVNLFFGGLPKTDNTKVGSIQTKSHPSLFKYFRVDEIDVVVSFCTNHIVNLENVKYQLKPVIKTRAFTTVSELLGSLLPKAGLKLVGSVLKHAARRQQQLASPVPQPHHPVSTDEILRFFYGKFAPLPE